MRRCYTKYDSTPYVFFVTSDRKFEACDTVKVPTNYDTAAKKAFCNQYMEMAKEGQTYPCDYNKKNEHCMRRSQANLHGDCLQSLVVSLESTTFSHWQKLGHTPSSSIRKTQLFLLLVCALSDSSCRFDSIVQCWSFNFSWHIRCGVEWCDANDDVLCVCVQVTCAQKWKRAKLVKTWRFLETCWKT